jgi:predicted nucleic acid-binding protein
MIVLDTNVLSELTRQAPDPGVVAWLDDLPAEKVATTVVTAAELLYGVAHLPDERRKTQLLDAVLALLNEDFRGRVAPFDATAAAWYATVVTDREQLGRPISVADAQIAAICRAHQATLATRNTKDFINTGIKLVDPWHHRSHSPDTLLDE